MPRVEAVRIQGGSVREHPEIQIGPVEAYNYLTFLRGFHLRPKGDYPEELLGTKEHILDEIEQTVEGINRGVLDRMLTDHPLNHGWAIGLTGEETDFDYWFDFHTMAANWDNAEFSGLRKVLERTYGVGVVELEFLRAAYEELPSVTSSRFLSVSA